MSHRWRENVCSGREEGKPEHTVCCTASESSFVTKEAALASRRALQRTNRLKLRSKVWCRRGEEGGGGGENAGRPGPSKDSSMIEWEGVIPDHSVFRANEPVSLFSQ